jgi:hypothetical protein
MTLVLRTRFPVTSFSRQRYSQRSGPALRSVRLRQPRWQHCRMLDTSSCNMPEGVPTENFVLFGAVEIAKPWSIGRWRHDRVSSTRVGSTRRYWRVTGIRNAIANGKKLGRPKRGVDRERILELKEQGQSLREIAASLGVGYGTVSARLLTSHVVPETSAGPIGTDDGLEVRIFGDVAVTTFYGIGTVM